METKAIGKSAFDIIYEKYAEYVYKTALYFCGNHHTAEEITQTVFLKYYINMGNVEAEGVKSWLAVSAKYMAINYKRDLEREILLEEILYGEDRDSDGNFSAEEAYIEKLHTEECRVLLENIFTELYYYNSRWYDAITITYLLGKPQKEVADIMNVKIEVLHTMLYRAKKWIKKKYEEQFSHLNGM